MCMSSPQYIQSPPIPPPATEAQNLAAAHAAAPRLSQRTENVTQYTTFPAANTSPTTPMPSKAPRKAAVPATNYQSLTIGT